MKHRITTDSMVHEFRLLRNRIEAEVEAPAVVFVTSATDGDGASLTAYGLAESLSKTQAAHGSRNDGRGDAGDDVTAAPTPRARRRASDRLEGVNHPANDGRLSVVSISPERVATISRSSVAGLVQELRVDHDYVIIDAGNLPKNSFGLLLDGVRRRDAGRVPVGPHAAAGRSRDARHARTRRSQSARRRDDRRGHDRALRTP